MLGNPKNVEEAKAEAVIQFLGGSLVFGSISSVVLESFVGIPISLLVGILVAILWSYYSYKNIFIPMVRNENLEYFLD